MDACVVDMARRVVTPRATRAGTYSEKRRKKRRSNYFRNPVSNPNFKRGGMKGSAGRRRRRRRRRGRFFKYSAEDGGRAPPAPPLLPLPRSIFHFSCERDTRER